MSEERRVVTILFADVAGSTALGEELDPEEMRALLARYYRIAQEAVDEHGGTLEKFIGDAVMAVFGLPIAHGDDPERALASALGMRDRLARDALLSGQLGVRFGIATGEVVAARETAADFLVTGDPVNVAARLQQAAEPGGVLAAERTALAAAAAFEFGPQIELAAKGKSRPVRARELLSQRTEPRRRLRLPLIGRESDFEQLLLAARRALDERRPSLVSIVAPAGTGKTRLVEEFLDRLPALQPQARTAIAQCPPYGQQLTYWPLRQVALALTGMAETASGEAIRAAVFGWVTGLGVDDAVRTEQLLAATLGAAEPEGVDKGELYAAWRSVLEAEAARRPLVVIFEDLHWSSDSLLELVDFVTQPRGEAALLMVALARPELLDRRPEWGGGRRNHLALSLEPLAPAAIAELVRHLIEGESQELVRLVVERSEGNPFFAGELVRSALETGSPDTLPDTVQGAVLARLDLLPPDQRRALQLGSVFGRSFQPDGVAALEETLAAGVDATCAELADRDLIRPARHDSYDFRHILIRDVAYGTLPRSERLRLHAAAGEWLERQAGTDAHSELVAIHFREAALLASALYRDAPETEDMRRRAVRWLRQAALTARAAGAALEAVAHLRAALELASPEVAPELHEVIGDLTGGDKGIEEYRLALAGYSAQGGSPADQLRALAGVLMIATRWQGSVADRPSPEEIAHLRAEGRRLSALTEDARAHARFLAADAFYPFWLQIKGRPSDVEVAEAEANAHAALEKARALDDPLLASAALDALGGVATTRGDWPAVRDLALQRLAFEDRLDLYERLDAYSMVAWASTWLGDLEHAERHSAEMAARLQPGQAPYAALHLYSWRLLILTLLGRWDEVVPMSWRALQTWRDAGSLAAGYAVKGLLGAFDVARERGDERLQAALIEALTSITRNFPATHHSFGTLQAHLEGRAVIDPDDPAPGAIQPPDLVERRLASIADRLPPEQTPEPVRTIVDLAVEGGFPVEEAQARRLLGLIAQDPEELRQALAIFERTRALPYVARVKIELGTFTGDSAAALEGRAILERIGDRVYLERLSVSG